MIKFRQKIYTVYDETDSLKRMRDSDIIAQKKKQGNGFLSDANDSILGAGKGALAGAAIGAGTAAGLRALSGGFGKKGLFSPKTGKKMGRWGKSGAAIGAGIGLLNAWNKQAEKRKIRQFYNDRLDYAQRHALRREKADWANNNLNREGYTY